jgi:phenylalanyl-tRNA synthetase beta chain
MQISYSWLKEWVDAGPNPLALAEELTLAGLEVSSVLPLTPLSPKIVIGEIVRSDRHPSRGTLQICKVDLGRKKTISVVCGATNALIGIKTAVALPGSILPFGKKVRRVNINGQISGGILCSAAEIGLEESSSGILEFNNTASVGQAVASYLDLDDTILDIELTPNRGDCLSVLGVAREVAAIRGQQIKNIEIRPRRATHSKKLPLSVTAETDAPRYLGRVIEGLDPSCKTPDWMKERLRRSGLRSLGSIVDITNFVMLELGQPLHAFDLAKVRNGIVVRHSRQGETLTLLDGTKLQLILSTLVIADGKGPIGLAGIMGGQSSGVSESTQSIFLESAYFRPNSIATRAREYGLQTDASYRFERGVDPTQQRRAVQRATALLAAICRGSAGPICEVSTASLIPKRKPILLRRKRLDGVLGVRVPSKNVQKILAGLDMRPAKYPTGWRARPPQYRFDLEAEHDLIEEIARLHGFINIPSREPHVSASRGIRPEREMPLDRIQDYLVDRDYTEVITYSFVDGVLQARVDPNTRSVEVSNPISTNMNMMRTTLWPGLLRTVDINYRRQFRRIRLFEVGHVFSMKGKKRIETQRLGGVCCGPASDVHWDNSKRSEDFFDIKGDLEGLLDLSGRSIRYKFVPVKHPALIPGESAEIRDGSKSIGHIGKLHPDIQQLLGFDFGVYLFEIDLTTICQLSIPSYRPVSRFPTVPRDLSVVVREEVPAEKVEEIIWSAAGHLLTSIRLFDVYVGKEIEKDCKSLSFALTLQSSSRNLTDKEVEAVLGRIVTTIQKLGGQLRSAVDPKS